MTTLTCRHCKSVLTNTLIDLINSPPSNSYLSKEDLTRKETYFPLIVYICEKCFLVQIDEHEKVENIFNEKYAYFSSYSKIWQKHCADYSTQIVNRFNVDKTKLVVEIASNDGCLLNYFKNKEIPVLGIEPSLPPAEKAQEDGIETITEFFSISLAEKLVADGRKADLIIGNNVLAHVPDINSFIQAMTILLHESGVITMEFPYVRNMIEKNQFDTIYHEHFSYFSFLTVVNMFHVFGLDIFDVDQIPTHGGSLRIYAKHKHNTQMSKTDDVLRLIESEKQNKIHTLQFYESFSKKVLSQKYAFVNFIINEKLKNKQIVAYGAAAKGNTLLNYFGIKKDIIDFVVDASPYKQGKFLPGSHIPIQDESSIRACKPDYILILPWNLKDEITDQLDYVREWGAKFIIPIPELEIV